MSLHFGLNVNSKTDKTNVAHNRSPAGNLLLDDDDEYDGSNDKTDGGIDAVEEISELSNRPTRDHQLPSKKPTKPPPSRTNPAKGPPTLRSKAKSQQPDYADLSSNRISHSHSKTATNLDASIYDYDAYHDAQRLVTSTRQAAEAAAEEQASVSTDGTPNPNPRRAPKYMTNLLAAAERRKKDQLVAQEKLLQHQRETEGDEFADKEKFVTAAYKLQQEETRRIEAEEAAKLAREEKERGRLGGGLRGFYKGIIDDGERRHEQAMDAARLLERGELPVSAASGSATETNGNGTVGTGTEEENSDVQLAARMIAQGVNVHINDEGQVTDKRQLLNAGLNVGSAAAKRAADDKIAAQKRAERAREDGQHRYLGSGKNDAARATRDRQTRMMEEQLERNRKRAAEEDEVERERIAAAAKSTKTQGDISDAKARYLARKAEAATAAATARKT